MANVTAGSVVIVALGAGANAANTGAGAFQNGSFNAVNASVGIVEWLNQ